MPDISQITLPSGTTYDIKDAVARQAIASTVTFRGVTSTELTDGSSTNPITINDESYTAVNGDLVIYDYKEFIFSTNDDEWHEFGDLSALGDLAYKDFASGTVTAEGTVSKPDVTITTSTVSISEFDDAGSVTAGTANVPTAVTLPTLTTSVSNEVLTLSWTSGTVTDGTACVPTAVTLPTSKSTTVLTGTTAELASTPTFIGTSVSVTVS